MERIYAFCGLNFKDRRLAEEVRVTSIQKGKSIELSPQVDTLCREMLERLDKAREQQITSR